MAGLEFLLAHSGMAR